MVNLKLYRCSANGLHRSCLSRSAVRASFTNRSQPSLPVITDPTILPDDDRANCGYAPWRRFLHAGPSRIRESCWARRARRRWDECAGLQQQQRQNHLSGRTLVIIIHVILIPFQWQSTSRLYHCQPCVHIVRMSNLRACRMTTVAPHKMFFGHTPQNVVRWVDGSNIANSRRGQRTWCLLLFA